MKKLLLGIILIILTLTSCIDNGTSGIDCNKETIDLNENFNPPKYVFYYSAGWTYDAFYCGFDSYLKTDDTYKLFDKNGKLIIEVDTKTINGTKIVSWENKPASKEMMIYRFKNYGLCPDCW